MGSQQTPFAVLSGAALDTGNLGVTALGLSTLFGLGDRGVSVLVLDNASGAGPLRLPVGRGDDRWVERQGAWYSRRIWRLESLVAMRGLSRSRFAKVHPWLRTWQRADVLLGLSGGDSFSDIYGEHRFHTVIAPTVIASRIGLPVLFLPQTYGPFHDSGRRAQAVRILASATQCWARDEKSFVDLQELLGSSYDPLRHRQGVDVAFALPSVQPPSEDDLLSWIEGDLPVIGINVSGLVASSGSGISGLSGQEYVSTISSFIAWANRNDYKVLLVPHVLGPSGESDEQACEEVIRHLDNRSDDRLRTLKGITHPGEVKYIISRLDWFTGARMHATIASLSTKVPTAATAYSGKFAGVFARCGVPNSVIDLRRASAREMLSFWQTAVESRDETRNQLGQHVPAVVEQADLQFDDILKAIGG